MIDEVFSQNDPKWQNELIGNSTSSTIGKYGCLITAYAMLAKYYKKDCTPDSLNKLFLENNCYINGSYLNASNVLQIVYPDISWRGTTCLENSIVEEKHINEIKQFLKWKFPCLIKLKTLYGHYVLAIGYDNGIIIADPQDGKIRKIKEKYGDDKSVISRIIYYSSEFKNSMALLSAGVVVDTKKLFHPAIQLAIVSEMSKDRQKTLIKTSFPDGTPWKQWVDTEKLEVVDMTQEITQLQEKISKIEKKYNEWKTKAENAIAEINESKSSLSQFEVIFESLGKLLNS